MRAALLRLLFSALVFASFVTVTAFGGAVVEERGGVPQQVPSQCIPPAFGGEDDAIVRPIDHATKGCGLEGSSAGDEPHEAQNLVKNNFCAWPDTDPALVTRKSFDELMKQMPTIPFGSGKTMPSAAQRKSLQGFYTTSEGDTIGEGSFVVFVGFLLEGHFGGAESVNCGLTKRADIDVHLALVTQKPSTLDLKNRGPVECSSITAEISPHHRPIEWDILGRITGTPAAQKLVKALGRLEDEDLLRPLRIKGQLMFDASHVTCNGNTPSKGQPPRRSGWEIHPVYSIEVCKFTTLQSCRFDQETVGLWTPLSTHLTGEEG